MSESKPIIVVTGGAGYLGRGMVARLAKRGFQPVILDDFSTGHRSAVTDTTYFEVDLKNAGDVRDVFAKLKKPHAVIHFAARALVPESIDKPDLYFSNNLLATLNTVQAAVEFGVETFIHSSSCSVYGWVGDAPITEATPIAPISPYGESKHLSERILSQYANHRSIRVVNLRYFNPAGALDGQWGECHEPETHLIPLVLAKLDRGLPVTVYGNDYATPDGSCIRDFIHVDDLAEAHLKALGLSGEGTQLFNINLGSGRGTSVLEVVRAAEKIVGKKATIDFQPRRPGDPPRLVASIGLAAKLLNWSPAKNIEAMVGDHYHWWKNKGALDAKRR